jgi:hypothetical protein
VSVDININNIALTARLNLPLPFLGLKKRHCLSVLGILSPRKTIQEAIRRREILSGYLSGLDLDHYDLAAK